MSLYPGDFVHVSLNHLQVWWAASDLGWVVGHSYICYGPLLHGNSTVLYEVRSCRQDLVSKKNYCSIANSSKCQICAIKHELYNLQSWTCQVTVSAGYLVLLALQAEYVHIWLMTPVYVALDSVQDVVNPVAMFDSGSSAPLSCRIQLVKEFYWFESFSVVLKQYLNVNITT